MTWSSPSRLRWKRLTAAPGAALQKGDKRLEVNIPPGARSGTRVRIGGAGGQGQAPGDLYLVVTVRPHSVFRRDGDDLHIDLPVDLYTAVLGGEVRVPTLAGDVMLSVPAETQAGKTFRLSGRGMPKLRKPADHGDFYARLIIQVPQSIDRARARAVRRAQIAAPAAWVKERFRVVCQEFKVYAAFKVAYMLLEIAVLSLALAALACSVVAPQPSLDSLARPLRHRPPRSRPPRRPAPSCLAAETARRPAPRCPR